MLKIELTEKEFFELFYYVDWQERANSIALEHIKHNIFDINIHKEKWELFSALKDKLVIAMKKEMKVDFDTGEYLKDRKQENEDFFNPNKKRPPKP